MDKYHKQMRINKYIQQKLLSIKLYFYKVFFKLNKDEVFIKSVIDDMLKPRRVTYDFVKKNSKINGVPWFQHYTMTKKEYIRWKKKTIKKIILYYNYSEEGAKKNFAYINLTWGLKIENNND